MSASESIHVLLVDDERLSLELHRNYVERLEGFRVVAEADGASAAVRALRAAGSEAERIDLVLLDMTMPDGSGLEVLRRARAKMLHVDVIPVTGIRDAETVRQVVALGAVHYLLKPFTFGVFRERMEQYREYRSRALAAGGAATQLEIDAMLGALRPGSVAPLPKGLSPESLERVIAAVRLRGMLSASEAAELVGMSRVAARRYLEYLAEQRRVERVSRYGTGGRPTTDYRWLA